MRCRRTWILGFLLSIGLVAPRGSNAAPNVWERAAQIARRPPAEGAGFDEEVVHRRAVELSHEASLAGGPEGPFGGLSLAKLEASRALLLRAGAKSSPRVLLRFDLGLVLGRLRRCEEASDVLKAALAMAPDDARAASAWFEVAICQAHRSHHLEETDAYLKALRLEDDPDALANIYANLAESQMAQGFMDNARSAIESSIALEPESTPAWWTLAVVCDRSDDPSAAFAAARVAIARDPDYARLDGPSIFFEPEYERDWYHGIGELAHAELAKSELPEYTLHLMKALVHFDHYVAESAADDRFRTRAEQRVKALQKQLRMNAPPVHPTATRPAPLP
ncbi:MAG: hypothetical protein NVS3B20_11850 [Polyangiales bacterium]